MPEQNYNYKPFLTVAGVSFLTVTAFGAGIFWGRDISVVPQDRPVTGVESVDVSYLEGIINILEQEYLGDLPTQLELRQGLARGLVESLDDQYSSYLSPSQTEDYFAANSGDYEGIGVQLGFDGVYTTVDAPVDNSPGLKAGLEIGDQILEVNGEDVAEIRPEIVATKIRGEAGTTVSLTIYRQSTSEVLDFEIMRQAIELEQITYSELGDSVYMIDIAKFTEGADGLQTGSQVFNSLWDRIASEVDAQNPKGLVIDLRNNPGGFVDSVRYVLEEFLDTNDIILREQEKNEPEVIYRDSRDGRFEDVPVVVLVNGASASASEIFAAAIQENDRGTVVGTETFGKGVEQKLITLPDDALLLLVFRNWLTPEGNQISAEQPIRPDHLVEFEQDDNDSLDSQVQKALELLISE